MFNKKEIESLKKEVNKLKNEITFLKKDIESKKKREDLSIKNRQDAEDAIISVLEELRASTGFFPTSIEIQYYINSLIGLKFKVE